MGILGCIHLRGALKVSSVVANFTIHDTFPLPNCIIRFFMSLVIIGLALQIFLPKVLLGSLNGKSPFRNLQAHGDSAGIRYQSLPTEGIKKYQHHNKNCSSIPQSLVCK